MVFENAKTPLIQSCGYTTLWVMQPWGWLAREILRFECTRFWLLAGATCAAEWEVHELSHSQGFVKWIKYERDRARLSPLAGDKSRSKQSETLKLLAAAAAASKLIFSLSFMCIPRQIDLGGEHESLFHELHCVFKALCVSLFLGKFFCVYTCTWAIEKHPAAKMCNLNSFKKSAVLLFPLERGVGNFSSWVVDESGTSWSGGQKVEAGWWRAQTNTMVERKDIELWHGVVRLWIPSGATLSASTKSSPSRLSNLVFLAALLTSMRLVFSARRVLLREVIKYAQPAYKETRY